MNDINPGVIWPEIRGNQPSLSGGEILAEILPPPEPSVLSRVAVQTAIVDRHVVEIAMSAWPEEPGGEIILVFASNTEVLNVEDFLEEEDLPFELVPVPKEVNPNCGLAISFANEYREDILTALNDTGFSPQAAYLRRDDYFQEISPFIIK